MSVFHLFTADATTDLCTKTSHGFNTGDGPAVVINVNGALPAPLVTLTDYWIIRIDANTFKIATSAANAQLGTAINLTTNGTGGNWIGLGLPFRRAKTYAALSQVRSADLNAMQDDLVRLAKSGLRVRHVPAAAGVQTAGTAMTWETGDDAIKTSATNNVFRIPISLNEGERILEVRAKVQTTAAGDTIAMQLKETDYTSGAGTTTNLGSSSATSSPPSVVILTSGDLAVVDPGAGFKQHYAEFTCSAFGSGTRISGLLVMVGQNI